MKIDARSPSATPVLTKSMFQLAGDCPKKLAYRLLGYPTNGPAASPASAVHETGYQVEALAQALYSKGVFVTPLAGETPAQATRRMWAAAGDVTLFEATLQHAGLEARVDILRRKGGNIELIEVKSKSCDSSVDVERTFITNHGEIKSEWSVYFEDLAFQLIVARGCLEVESITPFLLLVDTANPAPEGVLHRHLAACAPPVGRRDDRPYYAFQGDRDALLESDLLTLFDVSDEVQVVLEGDDGVEARLRDLRHQIDTGALQDSPPPVGEQCADCEFRHDPNGQVPPDRDGYFQCWGPPAAGGHVPDLFRARLLGGGGRPGIAELHQRGVRALIDVPLDEVLVPGRVSSQRQRIQVEHTRAGTEWFGPQLRAKLDQLPRPLHFIDFEGVRPVLPFYAGMHPYQQFIYQFSCHTVHSDDADGLTHREWIQDGAQWPVLEFAQALRRAIGDDGLVVCWSPYETIAIDATRADLAARGDARDLVEWLARLTGADGSEGRIVDLHRWCVEQYFHPRMGGGTSIKLVLPAVWQGNTALQAHPWFRGLPEEPYSALKAVDAAGQTHPAVRDGVAAQGAYIAMLHGPHSGDPSHRAALRRQLSEYCKLDTLAMVIIWRHWADRCT